MKNYIVELWNKIDYDSEEVKNTWNSRADAFNAKEDDEEHFADNKGIVEQLDGDDLTILDIGSADGRHTLNFASYASEVIGIDIADKMVDIANENARKAGADNVTVCLLSWEDADLDELGWNKKFDLVFANFSPAIHSSESVLKMTSASKQLCYLSQHVIRENTLRNELLEMFGKPERSVMMRDRIIAAFNTLWDAGYLPEIKYDRRVTKSTLDESEFEAFVKNLNIEDTNAAMDYLKNKAVNGSIEYDLIHLNAIMQWDVRIR